LTVVLVSRELLFATRLAGIAEQAGARLLRVDEPSALPAPSAASLVLVDWAERRPEWPAQLTAWCAQAPQSDVPRVILFGPHTDLEAHAAARAAGFGPMWARSRLLGALASLLS
jgi:hypothetical protein